MSETAYDTDKLTNMELTEAGITDAVKVTAKKAIEPARCCFCGRKVAQPITKYKIGGYDFVPSGKNAHKGCAESQVNALIKMLSAEKETPLG